MTSYEDVYDKTVPTATLNLGEIVTFRKIAKIEPLRFSAAFSHVLLEMLPNSDGKLELGFNINGTFFFVSHMKDYWIVEKHNEAHALPVVGDKSVYESTVDGSLLQLVENDMSYSSYTRKDKVLAITDASITFDYENISELNKYIIDKAPWVHIVKSGEDIPNRNISSGVVDAKRIGDQFNAGDTVSLINDESYVDDLITVYNSKTKKLSVNVLTWVSLSDFHGWRYEVSKFGNPLPPLDENAYYISSKGNLLKASVDENMVTYLQITSSEEIDLSDEESIMEFLNKAAPWKSAENCNKAEIRTE